MIPVLYEDNHLLVVQKPPNMPVQEDPSGDRDMLTELKGYIKEKYAKPGEVYLGLVHRLDRPVGGAMVFARTSKAAARLCSQFNGHAAKKTYLAVVEGQPCGGELSDFILRDEATGSSRAVKEGTPNAKAARLTYRPIASREGLTLVSIQLHTGRHHQIRVQFASRNMPLWGDQRYNKNALPGQQIALWACRLQIEHPTKKEIMTFTSMPKGGVWKKFESLIPGAAAGIPVVYADENIIIADKPAGLPTAKADGEGDCLEGRLEVYGRPKPAHRLDANTTGLVLFGRNEEALGALEEAIKQRSIKKFYRCTVKGRPAPASATLTAYCVKDEARSRVTVYDSPLPGSRDMITRYTVISSHGDTSELEVELVTGRTHQIRAHLAHIGHPILGDDKYGDREFNHAHRARVQQLYAVRLECAFEENSLLSYLNGRVFCREESPFEGKSR